MTISIAIATASHAVSACCCSSDIDRFNRTRKATSSNKSSETHSSPPLLGAEKNDLMCIIYIPPHEKKCHKREQPDCHDNYSELMAHKNSSCIYALLNCFCVAYDRNRSLIEYGRCLYNCFYPDKNILYFNNDYTVLPSEVVDWKGEVCGKFHRCGSLCGSCQADTYLMAYSYNLTCVKCGKNYKLNWLKFLFFAFFPLTVFCFVILLFHVSIPSSPLQGYTLIAQLVSAPALARVLMSFCKHTEWCKCIPPLGSLYGIWNLDFFRFYNLGICIKTDILTTLVLDLIVGVYPLVLIAITYLIIKLYDANCTILMKLWKPCERLSTRMKSNWNLRTSTLDAFASFLLLSNVKFLSACTNILIPVQVISSDPFFNQSSSSWRMYYNASIEYFGPKHCPYAITAIMVLVIFVLLPTLLLLLYPFQKFHFFLNKFPPRCILVINTLIDSFQGCYKDGAGSSKADYRWVSAFPFLIRIMTFLLYCSTPIHSFLGFESMLLIICAIIMIYLEPFKDHTVNKSFVVFILLVAYFSVGLFGHDLHYSRNHHSLDLLFSPLLLIGGCLPHLFIVSLLLKPLFKKVRICLQALQRHTKL